MVCDNWNLKKIKWLKGGFDMCWIIHGLWCSDSSYKRLEIEIKAIISTLPSIKQSEAARIKSLCDISADGLYLVNTYQNSCIYCQFSMLICLFWPLSQPSFKRVGVYFSIFQSRGGALVTKWSINSNLLVSGTTHNTDSVFTST